MAQTAGPKLDAGDRFPDMFLSLLDGTTLQIPTDLNSGNTILIGFRGKW